MKFTAAVASGLLLVSQVNAFGAVPESIAKYANNYLAPVVKDNKKFLDTVCAADEGDSFGFSVLGEECNPVVAKWKGEGYSSFSSQVRVNNGQGLPDAKFDDFVDMTSSSLPLPPNGKEEWKKAARDILVNGEEEAVTYRVIGCDKDSNCAFLSLIGKHNAEKGSSDISMIQVQMKFEFAPDILVVRETTVDPETGKATTNDVIQERPSKKKADVDQLLKFMEIVAFEKLLDSIDGNNGSPFLASGSEKPLVTTPGLNETAFMSKWGSYITELPLTEQRTSNREVQVQFLPFLTGLVGAVNSVTSAWSGIVSAFKSSYSKELQDMKMNRGFDKFKQSTKAFSGQGLPSERAEDFMNDLAGRLAIPDGYREDFKMLAKWIQFFDDQTWTQSDITFSKGKGGNANNFNFFSRNRGGEGKIDIVYLVCNQDFSLADDLYVWVTRKSTMGGLFSSTKTEIEKKPAALSEEQLKFVSEYFLLLAYQELARFMEITIPGNDENIDN